jgi:hypothetical protein
VPKTWCSLVQCATPRTARFHRPALRAAPPRSGSQTERTEQSGSPPGRVCCGSGMCWSVLALMCASASAREPRQLTDDEWATTPLYLPWSICTAMVYAKAVWDDVLPEAKKPLAEFVARSQRASGAAGMRISSALVGARPNSYRRTSKRCSRCNRAVWLGPRPGHRCRPRDSYPVRSGRTHCRRSRG